MRNDYRTKNYETKIHPQRLPNSSFLLQRHFPDSAGRVGADPLFSAVKAGGSTADSDDTGGEQWCEHGADGCGEQRRRDRSGGQSLDCCLPAGAGRMEYSGALDPTEKGRMKCQTAVRSVRMADLFSDGEIFPDFAADCGWNQLDFVPDAAWYLGMDEISG